MNKKCYYFQKTLFIIIFLLIPTLLSSQNIYQSFDSQLINENDVKSERFAKIGDMILPAVGYGLFRTAPHNTQLFERTKKYFTEFALWVGGKDDSGKIFVVSGDGNEKSGRPEWISKPLKTKIDGDSDSPQNFIEETNYTDEGPVEGHTPVGITVKQNLAAYVEKNYALLSFNVTNSNEQKHLNEVYIGLKVLIVPPGQTGSPFKSKTIFGTSEIEGKPFIINSQNEKSSGTLVGVVPYSSANVHLSWWGKTDRRRNDLEKYVLLKGTPDKLIENTPDVYTILVSAGPFNLSSGESGDFIVIIAQGAGEKDYEFQIQSASEFLEDVNSSNFLSKTAKTENFKLGPSEYKLEQNYPNPFNLSTTIEYHLIENADVNITIYDITGREVNKLVSIKKDAGVHKATWNGCNYSGITVASGVYFYKIIVYSENKTLFQKVNKMVLIK